MIEERLVATVLQQVRLEERKAERDRFGKYLVGVLLSLAASARLDGRREITSADLYDIIEEIRTGKI